MLFFTLAPTAMYYKYYRSNLDEYKLNIIKQRQEALGFFPGAIEKFEIVKKHSLFSEKQNYKHDAFDFIDSKIQFFSDQDPKIKKTLKKYDRSCCFEENATSVKNELVDQEVEKLFAKSRDPEIKNLNVSWIEELEKFDHINIYGSIKAKELLHKAVEGPYHERIEVQTINFNLQYRFLSEMALIYVLQGLETEDEHLKRLKAFRKVAELLYTTKNPWAVSSAIRMLRQEDKLLKVLNVKNWVVYADEVLSAYNTISHGWTQMLRSIVNSGEINTDYDKYFSPDYGICLGISNLSLSSWIVSKEFLAKKGWWDLTENFNPQISRLEELLKKYQPICGLESLSVLMEPTRRSFFDRSSLLYPYPFQGKMMALLTIYGETY